MAFSNPVQIEGILRSYPWGCTSRIQTLAAITHPKPLAELWFSCQAEGFSPQQQLQVSPTCRGNSRNDADGEHPGQGASVAAFPFMAKLLAIASPLSIQVHPDTLLSERYYPQAEPHYASISSGCGKYETLLALDTTEVVAGPASWEQVEALLPPSLHGLRQYRQLHQTDPHRAFITLLQRIEQATSTDIAEFEHHLTNQAEGPHSALASHLRRAWDRFDADPLVMGLAAMQYTTLEPGQRIHIRPGVPHCYLSGFGLEITSPSENIARFGLTDKVVNPELFYECLRAINPTFEDGCCVPGVNVTLESGQTLPAHTHELRIPLQIDARVKLETGETIRPGNALLIPAGAAAPRLTSSGLVATVSWADLSL